MKTSLKSIFAIGIVATFAMATMSCEETNAIGKSDDPWAGLVNEDSKTSSVNGNTLTYGDHTYTVDGKIEWVQATTQIKDPTATVTFTHIPSGYTEFSAVYQFLGKYPHGVAAMGVMAEEIYARNATVGEKCFNLLCGETNAAGIIRILKTKFNYSKYSPEDDKYVQRYLPAALLKGASYDNAYTPDYPYVVEMASSANKPQMTWDNEEVTFIYTFGFGGWDSFQRGAEVTKKSTGLYQLTNCPSYYTQCKNIVGTWKGLK